MSIRFNKGNAKFSVGSTHCMSGKVDTVPVRLESLCIHHLYHFDISELAPCNLRSICSKLHENVIHNHTLRYHA